MARCDPVNVAVDWLDAYQAASANEIVAMHRPDAVIECTCGGPKEIHGRMQISDYWQQRVIESPALGLEQLKVDGRVAVISYRTINGNVHARLDVASDGLITYCKCGPTVDVVSKFDWIYALSFAGTLMTTVAAICILLFTM